MSENKLYAIIGLGTFGAQAARELYERGAEVVAIDNDQTIIDRIKNEVTSASCGDAVDEEVLKSVGILEADVAIISMRNNFEETVLVTHLLAQKGIKDIWVQVNSGREASAVRALGASESIFPEFDIARNVVQRMLYPGLAEVLPLGKEHGLVEIKAPISFEGKTLLDLDIRRNYRVNVVGIKRERQSRFRSDEILVDPLPDEPFQKDDVLLILGRMDRLSDFQEKTKEKSEKEAEAEAEAEEEKKDG